MNIYIDPWFFAPYILIGIVYLCYKWVREHFR